MNVNDKLFEKGVSLGKALKNKDNKHYAKNRLHNVLEPYVTINDKIEWLLEFAVNCDKELPMEIIGGENREKDIEVYIAGVVNGLNKK